ncbi:MAG: hypothetical protein EOP45_13545 [Sphingobacteriaceae bacterium]|nr:MAG: hypothetical protein EOP45_13545 [Sphingobacteriaceae bacterium]
MLSLFGSLDRKKITSPKTFWRYASEQGHPKIASFAMDYLEIPASTAQLERLFLQWAFIHSDTRNRLSEDTSKKLLNIYFMLRSTDEVNDDSETEVFD